MNCHGSKQTKHGKTKMQRVNCHADVFYICSICLKITPEEVAEIQEVEKATQVIPLYDLEWWLEVEDAPRDEV